MKALCAWFLLVATAIGAGPTLVITDAGYQVMEVGADGRAALRTVDKVVDLRNGDTDPPPPPPDVSDPIAKRVAGWTAEINDPTSAQALTIVYREVGKASAGKSRNQVLTALRQATDAALSATKGTEKWKPWRANVSDLIDELEAQGPVDWPEVLDAIADGLESASSSEPALPPDVLRLIIELVLQIINVIFGDGGSGV